MSPEEKAELYYPENSNVTYDFKSLRAAFVRGAKTEQTKDSLGIDFYSTALGAERKKNQLNREALVGEIELIEQLHRPHYELGYEDEPYCTTCVRRCRPGESLTYQEYPCKTATLLNKLKEEFGG